MRRASFGGIYPGEQFYPAVKIGSIGRADLWVGSARDAADADWLARHRIGFVVNCTKHLPENAAGLPCTRVPVDDDPSEAGVLLQHLPKTVAGIGKAMDRGVNVLVHCHAGMSRSASVAACFIAKKTCQPMDDVIAEMQDRKPETFPVLGRRGRPNFWSALVAWEEQLRCRRRSE